MSPSAWITCVIVSVILYGGFAVCLAVAIRRGREGRRDDEQES
ncbi:MAG: MetS family NSS transporter small subunit [Candidatus Eisenbacteria bacterium]|nr:MetS family NSS transporter small subunit [Candidatus Eisenbacteria bacterium]